MTTTAGATGVVLAERRDGVLTMTINRPGQKNAVNHGVSALRSAAVRTVSVTLPRMRSGRPAVADLAVEF